MRLFGCILYLIVTCAAVALFIWSANNLVELAREELETIRIVVTATPTPEFQWGDVCAGYCPTPCACQEF